MPIRLLLLALACAGSLTVLSLDTAIVGANAVRPTPRPSVDAAARASSPANPATTQAQLAAVAGDRYSYREMDEFTDRVEKAVKALPSVSKVTRSGILPEAVYLMFSQERLAAYGLKPGTLHDALRARAAVPGALAAKRERMVVGSRLRHGAAT
jgi:multidrug efflux pump subunit AcrB